MVEEKQKTKEKKQKEESTRMGTGAKENQEKIEIPEKFKKLVIAIEEMKVGDLAELIKVLEKKFGVSAAASSATIPAAGAPVVPSAAPVEEKALMSVLLQGIGEKKIEVIKAVRDITQKGLKEAKDLVDAVAQGPQLLQENIKREEAEEMKKKLEGIGAKIELK